MVSSPDFFSCLADNGLISKEHHDIIHKQIENITKIMSINAAKSCKVKFSDEYCDSRSYKAVVLDLQLRTTSERKKEFLELIGTSETTDITIDINDHLDQWFRNANDSDDIKDNGELENS